MLGNKLSATATDAVAARTRQLFAEQSRLLHEWTDRLFAGLLAFLACMAPDPQSREKLSTLLWGSHLDAQAKQNLRQALFKLRQILGQDALKSDPNGS